MILTPTDDLATHDQQQFETPLKILVQVEQKIADHGVSDSTIRQINFMTYELETLCRNHSPEESFAILNNYFFYVKNFKTNTYTHFIQNILATRRGTPAALTLLYYHFGRSLGLNFQLLNLRKEAFIRWDLNGRPFFVSLEKAGQILSNDELLAITARYKNGLQQFNLNEALFSYVTQIADDHKEHEEKYIYLHSLNFLLELDSTNTRNLAARALLRKDLGLKKEAMCDMKRYFCFIESSLASSDLQRAYEELLQRGC